MLEDMPEEMPDRVQEDMPEHIAEDMPGRMPGDMPDRMPEDMPDKMPEDMSNNMPEDLPVTKHIDVMVGITRSKVILKAHDSTKTNGLSLIEINALRNGLQHLQHTRLEGGKPGKDRR